MNIYEILLWYLFPPGGSQEAQNPLEFDPPGFLVWNPCSELFSNYKYSKDLDKNVSLRHSEPVIIRR